MQSKVVPSSDPAACLSPFPLTVKGFWSTPMCTCRYTHAYMIERQETAESKLKTDKQLVFTVSLIVRYIKWNPYSRLGFQNRPKE